MDSYENELLTAKIISFIFGLLIAILFWISLKPKLIIIKNKDSINSQEQ